MQDRCAQIAASLTFATLLSLVPLLTITLTVFSAFPVFEGLADGIRSSLSSLLFPGKSADTIALYMQQFANSAMRLTTAGVVILTITAMLMMLTIDQAFNTIWRTSRQRPLVKRLVIYWAVLTIGPLLIGASLSLTSWLMSVSMGYTRHIPGLRVELLKVLPIIFTTLAFAMLFRLIPNRYVPYKHALIGAIVAAVVFEAMSRMFGYYISHIASYKLVYGAFASVPIFLMWIYLSWLTILCGAVIAATLSHWGATDAKYLPPVIRLLDALRVLQMMQAGLQQGKTTTFPELSKSLRLGYDSLEILLERLVGADMVCKAEGVGWIMKRDAEHIRLSELLHLFLLDGGNLLGRDDNDPVLRWLAQCSAQLEQSADMSLRELFSRDVARVPRLPVAII